MVSKPDKGDQTACYGVDIFGREMDNLSRRPSKSRRRQELEERAEDQEAEVLKKKIVKLQNTNIIKKEKKETRSEEKESVRGS
ncbi:hypothetical protein RRG08_061272 [Elysia crispata]|uniref:Uncharacterized protein n=1 Tax=Elysia crispata TaxID=231223 RepID=A0AAE0ZGE1_9GAST|nr:hypothetical protein RRG08_061272 [Elysia crispata]